MVQLIRYTLLNFTSYLVVYFKKRKVVFYKFSIFNYIGD